VSLGNTGRFGPRLLALLAGALTVFAFAPFEVGALPLATLGALFWLWQRAPRPRDAAALGFCFGLGLFGTGVSWVSIALATFGGMPWPVALVATAGFVAYLALWPALAGWATARAAPEGTFARVVAAAAAWTLAEWLRGVVLTGFPWLAVGYAQSPGHPLAGLAPLGGIWAVSLAVAISAALFAWAVDALAAARHRSVLASIAAIAALFAGGAALDRLAWTTPVGPPLAVSLLQGNVQQDLKFDAAFLDRTFDLYVGLARQSRGRLIVTPESAFPIVSIEAPPDVLQALEAIARSRNGDLLLGLFTMDPAPFAGGRPRFYNSVASLGTAPTQLYRKHHLVPFGEVIPLEPVLGPFIRGVLAIPMDSQSPGAANPPPLRLAGQDVAVNICYEDLFADQIAAHARTASLLVNVTNDAWYGRSIAAWQHEQIGAMRARETGRPMLRATNTGITSAFDAQGRRIASLPWFTQGVLEVEVAGHEGWTPYVRHGDAPPLVLAAFLFALATWRAVAGPRRR
jgi:apolipoprotein N-acyltransferase